MNNLETYVETIVAQATPIGQGGIGVIRVSGPYAKDIAEKVLGFVPAVRKAVYTPFKDFRNQDQILDMGIAIFFAAPNSFTGEDVLELQAHGGQIILSELINVILATQLARIANPGEFSQQAFLNDKIDLVQAEAIADLITASSLKAARGALNSLQGEFSKYINQLIADIIYLRTYIEAAIDFSDEEIDFLEDGKVINLLASIKKQVLDVLKKSQQGILLNEGMTAVIVGQPNAGKSSLMNALIGDDYAIVTEIAGTTRDVLRENIHIDGLPLHIVDTAGLRETQDIVEKIGIERALAEVEKANLIILVHDSADFSALESLIPVDICHLPKIYLQNKIDLTNTTPGVVQLEKDTYQINISAKYNLGIDELKETLKKIVGFDNNTEGTIIARKRHIIAIENAQLHIDQAYAQLQHFQSTELVAEDLRMAQIYLGEIGGKFTSDDLLGNIFSSFCIGK